MIIWNELCESANHLQFTWMHGISKSWRCILLGSLVCIPNNLMHRNCIHFFLRQQHLHFFFSINFSFSKYFANASAVVWMNISIIDTKFFTVVIVVLFRLVVRKWIQGGQFHSNVRIDGKVAIVTGCNTGICYDILNIEDMFAREVSKFIWISRYVLINVQRCNV